MRTKIVTGVTLNLYTCTWFYKYFITDHDKRVVQLDPTWYIGQSNEFIGRPIPYSLNWRKY